MMTADLHTTIQNKTSCAVQLRHIPTNTIIKCQASRSQSQNRKVARQLLADKVEAVEKGSESRNALKAETKSRKKASKTKKARRKYKSRDDESEDSTRESQSVPHHEVAEDVVEHRA